MKFIPNNKYPIPILLLLVLLMGGLGFYLAINKSSPPIDNTNNAPTPTSSVEPSITETPTIPEDAEIVDNFYCKEDVIYGVTEEIAKESTLIIPSWCSTIAPDVFVDTNCYIIHFSPRVDDSPIQWAPSENNKLFPGKFSISRPIICSCFIG